jgi:lipopolysaccharide transport system ATP-binding protein
MDEVLAVGDATFQSKCIQKLQTLINNGKTILFVSHNEQAINEYCNRVIYLSNSEIKDIGKAEAISKEYKEDINS